MIINILKKKEFELSLFIFLIFSFPLFSQNAIDTLYINSGKIIILDNFTWKFTENDIVSKRNVFTTNWETNQIFAYLKNSKSFNLPYYRSLVKKEPYYRAPINGPLYQDFKNRHDGIDIGFSNNDTIRAFYNGKVRFAAYNNNGYGNLIIIRHPNELETYYAHLSKLLVSSNDTLKTGDIIGLGGSSGRSKSPHLHFEIRYHDFPIDPFLLIDKSHIIDNTKKLLPVKEEKNIIKTLIDTTILRNVDDKNIQYHIVKKGDTFYNVSKTYNISVEAIKKLNSINSNTIHIGQKLRVF